VVSGVTMSFQFGTNWPGFMQIVGNIAGPLLAYEVLTAFFLEATFLGIMLFGFGRVSNRIHTLATILVVFGTSLSAFWILALNAWMQTPAGFEMIDGRAHATDWFAIVFNPSFPYRLIHMMMASGLTIAFMMAGVSAYRWRRGDKNPSVLAALKTGVYLGALLIPLQIFGGDLLGLNTLRYQPAKIAAIEGLWETKKGAPLLLFAIPDEKARKNHYEIGIPKLASLILTHQWEGELKGLNEFVGKHPPVPAVFWSFRIMVVVGVFMLLFSWLAGWQLWRRGETHTILTLGLIAMTFSGWIATVAGWYVTEIGRQPYLVYGVMTTKQAASNVSAGMISTTLIAYLLTYVLLTLAYISTVFYLARKAGDH
jgi:cytochrome bd ubiquinol oxidase subunit I